MSTLAQMNAVQALLAQTSLANTLFAANSRYYGLATETYVTPAGATIAYVERRFLPDASDFQVIQYHSVVQDERLDNIAAKFLGDPTLFWRLCDANNAMRPGELEVLGRTLRITMPQDVTGSAL